MKPNHQLTIIPAGAGSGKTHRIQVELLQRIKAGLDPAKVVAVTFTEAAAAELRGRIRAALVKEGMLDQALRLDQAYISTIHGFGLRLITEFAFDGGISPTPRKLSDDEQSMLVSRSLARSEYADQMTQRLTKYGYSPDVTSQKSAEQVFRESILKFISTLRTIDRDTGSEKLTGGIEQQIRTLYGEPRLADHLKSRLLDAVTVLLRSFPSGVAELSSVADSIKETLRKEFILFKQAEKDKPLDTDWKLWKQLGKLKTYKNPASKFPSGYQELAEDVIAAAEALPFHPGPLQDALEHAELLLQIAAECLSGYAADKQSRSLLDFTDMVSQSRKMLCLNDQVIECLRERVSCLVIDEFQDTNPLQFSLLWALTRTGIPTIIVGDVKQAIMGFQGADARLLQQLCDKHPDNTSPLPGNWRTAQPLMEIINHFGKGLFGDGYQELKPMADFSSKLKSPLELVVAENSLKNDLWASHLVERLHTLLVKESNQVFDKKTGEYRPLRGSDIAILCPSSKARMKAYSTALNNAGIRSRMQQSGWYSSAIVQLACYALHYVADPGDTHAALYLAVTELGRQPLQSALEQFIEKGDCRSENLHGKLDAVAQECCVLPVDEILAGVIKVLDLYTYIATQADAAQARANLLRLQEECCEFRNSNREALACGGYYGSGIKTFLAWLKDKVTRDDSQPAAAVLDEDAVQLVTWHSSKGREWPIVAVCGMEDDFAPRLPDVRVEYEDFSDFGAILEKVRVEILPAFDSSDTNEKFIAALQKDAEDAATRLLYVALTRSREKLILEWPEHHAGTRSTRKNKSYWDLFIEKTGAHRNAGTLECGVLSADYYKIATDTEPWVIDVPPPSTKLSTIGRRAVVAKPLPSHLTPEMVTPSSLHSQPTDIELKRVDEAYGNELELKITGTDDAMAKGIILHRAFEILSGHSERADLLSDAVGVELDETQSAAVCSAVVAFDTWLSWKFSPIAIHAEVPLLALNENGSVVHGFADMVVESADGFWIVDHKSDQVATPEKMTERFNSYYPQLKCYADSLQSARSDKPVKGILINWVSFGRVSWVENAG